MVADTLEHLESLAIPASSVLCQQHPCYQSRYGDRMDAAEQEKDVLLQGSAPDLLDNLQKSLKSFLWNPSGKIRKRVKVKETDRLVNLVDYILSLQACCLLTNIARTISRAPSAPRSPPQPTAPCHSRCASCLSSVISREPSHRSHQAANPALERNLQTSIYLLQDQRRESYCSIFQHRSKTFGTPTVCN